MQRESCLAALRQAHGLLKKSVAQMAKLWVIQTDVTRPDSVKNAVEQVRSELGQITALAYNASVTAAAVSLELDPKTIQQSFEVGVMGAVYLGRRVITDTLSAGHGFISLTGATAALRGRAGFCALAIAKASLGCSVNPWRASFTRKEFTLST